METIDMFRQYVDEVDRSSKYVGKLSGFRPMRFRAERPNNELLALPPKAEFETKPALKACIEARAALAELKGVAALIPNQSVLINSIPLLEAQVSSVIENIVTTTDRLFRVAGEGVERATYCSS